VWDGREMRVSACHSGLWRFEIEWIIEVFLLVLKPQIHPAHVFKIGTFIASKGDEFPDVGF
jgi:hypothetical protein